MKNIAIKEITHQQAIKYLHTEADKSLQPREHATLENHLANCPTCQAYAAELGTTEKRMRQFFQNQWHRQTLTDPLPVIQTQMRRNMMQKQNFQLTSTILVTAILVITLAGILTLFLPGGNLASTIPPTLTENTFPETAPSIADNSNKSSETPSAPLQILSTNTPATPFSIGEIEHYTVNKGDTIFSIAEKFGLNPETILLSNRETLSDDVNALYPGLELNILPVDGVYHQWRNGESFMKVAEFYGVDPEVIVAYSGNHLDAATFDINNPSIKPGNWLIIPGGKREFMNWWPPTISRSNPAIAKTYGPGYCNQVYSGAIGFGTFTWPTTLTFLSGYDYAPSVNHFGMDIAAELDTPVYASDSGVIVFSGWSEFGYGYLIILDHGNGYQSIYAHLNKVIARCGESVTTGQIIGETGITGNTNAYPHLHFEIHLNGEPINPWTVLPEP